MVGSFVKTHEGKHAIVEYELLDLGLEVKTSLP